MKEKILVEISARHVHLSQKDLELLFGQGHELTKKKGLSQPGEFASEERVTLVGPKGEIKNVIILGPVRANTQVEISLTDSRSLGVVAMIRESGDIEGTNGCKLVGPVGEVTIEQGVIAAKRHLHLTPEQAANYDVKNQEIVSVKVETPDRTTTFGDVVVRIKETFDAAMHLDTDEGNAAGIQGSAWGEIIKES